jgi:hypothetical protein
MMMNKNQFDFSTTFANTKIKTYLGSSGAKAKNNFLDQQHSQWLWDSF